MLTLEGAQRQIELASTLNPGPWISHSQSVAENARLIAAKIPHLDADQAFVLGLMHDIGRRFDSTDILHVLDGYRHMMGMGHPDIARICLTHSFPYQDIEAFSGPLNCSEAEKDFLADYIKNAAYDDYDRLIQLCDALSLPNGACIMEKRLVDVALRHGFTDITITKWKAFMHLKSYFDQLCGCNIYTLLPNVIENSFTNLI